MKNNQKSFSWTNEEYNSFSQEVQLLKHQYANSSLFSNEALLDLLDNYPRKWLQCYTMGTDPEKHNDWTPVHISDSTGKEILKAVEKGRLWVNVTNIDKYNDNYAQLIDKMYQQIGDNCPAISNIRSCFSAILISSPKVQVYCHVDTDANMLWHLKGTKRAWAYPANDARFTPQTYIEEIVAGERHENIPYETWYDKHAVQAELKPGDLLSWPQHSPHRIENVDLNISLTTSYASKESRRLIGVHGANHFFLKKLGIKKRSTSTAGITAIVKEYSYLILNKIGLLKHGGRTKSYISDLVVDPSSDTGVRTLESPRRTAFSYADS
jgi:hypothetical protein